MKIVDVNRTSKGARAGRVQGCSALVVVGNSDVSGAGIAPTHPPGLASQRHAPCTRLALASLSPPWATTPFCGACLPKQGRPLECICTRAAESGKGWHATELDSRLVVSAMAARQPTGSWVGIGPAPVTPRQPQAAAPCIRPHLRALLMPCCRLCFGGWRGVGRWGRGAGHPGARHGEGGGGEGGGGQGHPPRPEAPQLRAALPGPHHPLPDQRALRQDQGALPEPSPCTIQPGSLLPLFSAAQAAFWLQGRRSHAVSPSRPVRTQRPGTLRESQ